jgi:hypothetical protein
MVVDQHERLRMHTKAKIRRTLLAKLSVDFIAQIYTWKVLFASGDPEQLFTIP